MNDRTTQKEINSFTAPDFGPDEHRPRNSDGTLTVTIMTPDDWEPARILEVSGHLVTFAFRDTTECRWTHDAARLRAVADLALPSGNVVTLWSPGRRILQVSLGATDFLIDLHRASDQSSGNQRR
ncbi:hypothetical protein [Corynebacterium sp. TAE3-ERU16]|uniref:hypothetical protein n=1 Tax=Corynebacterium sp. TAE3-ERU16 TaxID=2849493 RepID=UPI001C46DB3D|nr:hypothetical protein [Corynebacterium sp. TAE3-ERU16]MBV7292287.1 hypothetical protein [Corynebacterium sp. TAE3-ERU16]